MSNNLFVVTAAGGNATAIEVLDRLLSRSEYQNRGKQLDSNQKMRQLEVDQVGFLVPSKNRFEMAGGEFCGNASRAAALLLANLRGRGSQTLTVSGFDGQVACRIAEPQKTKTSVECRFPELPCQVSEKILDHGQMVAVVDLGGIVHVLVENEFPQSTYQIEHQKIIRELQLEDQLAVGVIWCAREGQSIRIDPVVWVKDVGTFYYESSCGSGSIAAAKFFGLKEVVQPTGGKISVDFPTDDQVPVTVLKSEMEVILATATQDRADLLSR